MCAPFHISTLGFKPAKHMVFSGLYPADGSDFEALNHAIERLTCNDASVSVAKESSTALGLGFRCVLPFFVTNILLVRRKSCH